MVENLTSLCNLDDFDFKVRTARENTRLTVTRMLIRRKPQKFKKLSGGTRLTFGRLLSCETVPFRIVLNSLKVNWLVSIVMDYIYLKQDLLDLLRKENNLLGLILTYKPLYNEHDHLSHVENLNTAYDCGYYFISKSIAI